MVSTGILVIVIAKPQESGGKPRAFGGSTGLKTPAYVKANSGLRCARSFYIISSENGLVVLVAPAVFAAGSFELSNMFTGSQRTGGKTAGVTRKTERTRVDVNAHFHALLGAERP